MSTVAKTGIYLPVPEVDFQEEGHIYTHRGIRLLSVTQIMEPMSTMLYANVPEDVLAFAAERGTRVHEQISNYVQYGITETDEQTEPYFDAYLQFEKDINPRWLDSEYRTHHKSFNYAGTLDLIGFVTPDDGTGVDLVDIKTTANYHGVMLATQVGAYAKALESHGVTVRNRYGLQLMRNRTYRFEKLEDGFPIFLSCMVITKAMLSESRA